LNPTHEQTAIAGAHLDAAAIRLPHRQIDHRGDLADKLDLKPTGLSRIQHHPVVQADTPAVACHVPQRSDQVARLRQTRR
jgi:hypothetical protein